MGANEPIVRWYFGLKGRNFRGVVMRQSKFGSGSMWYGLSDGSLLSISGEGVDWWLVRSVKKQRKH